MNFEVKIADFGVSRMLINERDRMDSNASQFGRVTHGARDTGAYTIMPQYALSAPDTASTEYDSKADIWGVGLIAYFLLTNNNLFKNSQTPEEYRI